jgi:hypothetical protein
VILTAAGLLAAEGHGPGRNPLWVNVILVVIVIGGLAAWRIRTVRKKPSAQRSDTGPAGQR